MPSSASDITRAYPQTAGWADKIVRAAGTLSIPDPGWLANLMSFESNLKPQARNKVSGATGLIQFMPSTAKSLGTSTDALYRMSATQQLPFVIKYLKKMRGRGAYNTSGDLYMAVFYPVAIGKPPTYDIAGHWARNRTSVSDTVRIGTQGGTTFRWYPRRGLISYNSPNGKLYRLTKGKSEYNTLSRQLAWSPEQKVRGQVELIEWFYRVSNPGIRYKGDYVAKANKRAKLPTALPGQRSITQPVSQMRQQKSVVPSFLPSLPGKKSMSWWIPGIILLAILLFTGEDQ